MIVASLAAALVLGGALPASADDPPPPITGAGSTWAAPTVHRWTADILASADLTVSYSGVGSAMALQDFQAGSADFAVIDAPTAATLAGGAPEPRAHAVVPALAGGLSIAYQLRVGGAWITDLELSSSTIAAIFTGAVTSWDDPSIQAENPHLTLPATPIVPVLRADSSATTTVLTQWLAAEQPAVWSAFATANGLSPAPMAIYPVFPGAQAQSGSNGVAGYITQGYGDGAIGYVEGSYAQELGLPVARVQNHSGAYVAPTPQSVTTALRSVRIEHDPLSPAFGSADLRPVHESSNPEAYPLSYYAALIVPTQTGGSVTTARGATLAAFGASALCSGQQRAVTLGNAALPMNLVAHGFTELARIPGSTVALDVATCANPANTGGAISPLFGEFDSTAGASATVVNGNLVIRATPAHAGATVDVWVEGEATPRHTGVALNTSGSATLSSTVPAGRKVALTQGTSVLAWLSTADVEYLEPSDATHAATRVTIPTPAPGATTVTIPAGAAQANQTFSVLGWSAPTSLGQVTTDGTGAATIDASALGLGDHTIALVDGSGEYVAWGTATFSAAPAEGDLEVNVTATGVFSLTGVASSVDLGDVQRGEVTSVTLPNFTVIDDRALLPGWTLTAAVDTFVNGAAGGDQIPASALTIAPAIVSGESTGLTLPGSPLAGAGVFAEGALNSSTLEAGTVFNALLRFAAPATAKAGTYTSTLTLTLVSK